MIVVYWRVRIECSPVRRAAAFFADRSWVRASSGVKAMNTSSLDFGGSSADLGLHMKEPCQPPGASRKESSGAKNPVSRKPLMLVVLIGQGTGDHRFFNFSRPRSGVSSNIIWYFSGIGSKASKVVEQSAWHTRADDMLSRAVTMVGSVVVATIGTAFVVFDK